MSIRARSLEAIADSKLTIEDDNLYQLAIALADNYRCGNWKELERVL